MKSALSILLDNPDFIIREIVEIINEAVDPLVMKSLC